MKHCLSSIAVFACVCVYVCALNTCASYICSRMYITVLGLLCVTTVYWSTHEGPEQHFWRRHAGELKLPQHDLRCYHSQLMTRVRSLTAKQYTVWAAENSVGREMDTEREEADNELTIAIIVALMQITTNWTKLLQRENTNRQVWIPPTWTWLKRTESTFEWLKRLQTLVEDWLVINVKGRIL